MERQEDPFLFVDGRDREKQPYNSARLIVTHNDFENAILFTHHDQDKGKIFFES